METQSNNYVINGLSIHVSQIGQQNPPMVFLHGAMDSGLCWLRSTKPFQENYTILMPDFRGHGLSDAPEEESAYRFSLMADDVLELFRQLNIRNAILVGHSMGGAVGLIIATKIPERVNKLILEDPGIFLRSRINIKGRILLLLFTRWLKKMKNMSIEELKIMGRKQNPTWHEEEIEPWAESKKQFNDKHPLKVLRGLKEKIIWEEILQKVTVPTLIITADKGIIPKKETKKIISLLKNGNHVHIENAGHNIRREQYEEFIKVISDFL
jgi:pimeloyl-ACP methyl ester carboxylesterase